jgi:hypothetical protein
MIPGIASSVNSRKSRWVAGIFEEPVLVPSKNHFSHRSFKELRDSGFKKFIVLQYEPRKGRHLTETFISGTRYVPAGYARIAACFSYINRYGPGFSDF